MDGILPLWKPKGLTSHDCVIKVRRLFKTKKVGHTGTLDPEVEGMLPICIGQATKIVPFLTDTKKTYIAEILLGQATETEDSYGNVVETKDVTETFAKETIIDVLNQFSGSIKQVPPMYSAVKVKGKKLYEYARAGESVDRPERTVDIHDIQLIEENFQQQIVDGRFSFRVVCSKGTYIRTLCVDIGKALGYPAHMSHLVRLKTGSFDKNDAVTFDEIEIAVEGGSPDKLLLPIEKGVDHLDVLHIDEKTAQKVRNGQKLALPDYIPATSPFRIECNNKLIAIYQLHPNNDNEIKPVRVFQTND